MIGYLKATPSQYVLKYKSGKLKKKGAGISFFYYRPSTTIQIIPISSEELPFIFSEVTADYQDLAIGGQLTYRIEEAEKICQYLDFTHTGTRYKNDDYKKLAPRLLNILQEEIKKIVEKKRLREALSSASEISNQASESMMSHKEIIAMGISISGLRLNSMKPTPETSRALEAEMREQILQEADEAIYRRRNAAIEQERSIEENRLNTEIAMEEKKRQIQEKQLLSEREEQEARAQMERKKVEEELIREKQRIELIKLKTGNERREAETEGIKIAEVMKGFNVLNADILEAIKYSDMTPNQLLADGFRNLAKESGKIGNLTITPDLFSQLVKGNA